MESPSLSAYRITTQLTRDAIIEQMEKSNIYITNNRSFSNIYIILDYSYPTGGPIKKYLVKPGETKLIPKQIFIPPAIAVSAADQSSLLSPATTILSFDEVFETMKKANGDNIHILISTVPGIGNLKMTGYWHRQIAIENNEIANDFIITQS